MRSTGKKAGKILLKLIGTVLAIALIYVAYVFIAYHRLGSMPLEAEQAGASGRIAAGREQKIMSWNIGFGAYEADYDFFLDGGKQSWAKSKESLDKNLNAMGKVLKEQDASLYLLQEVDFNSTRTYHVDEREYFKAALPGMARVFAQNYDSPFLFYPLTQPHGRSRSGIMSFSAYGVTDASRTELPIDTSLNKLLDLDRCYSKLHIQTDNGRELVLYNFHLSAYASSGDVSSAQLRLLLADMKAEFEKGNYCIAGGDFNKDLLGDSDAVFGVKGEEMSWNQPIPEGSFDGTNMRLIVPFDEKNPVPSCRQPDSAYHKGQYVVTLDGFIVSDNVTAIASDVLDCGFAYSDHNPVTMSFTLIP